MLPKSKEFAPRLASVASWQDMLPLAADVAFLSTCLPVWQVLPKSKEFRPRLAAVASWQDMLPLAADVAARALDEIRHPSPPEVLTVAEMAEAAGNPVVGRDPRGAHLGEVNQNRRHLEYEQNVKKPPLKQIKRQRRLSRTNCVSKRSVC